MEKNLHIDVATLDTPHRLALEEVIGRQLTANQRLIIAVADVEVVPSDAKRPAQTLDDWTHVYDGLSDEEVEAIDEIAKTRAVLTHAGQYLAAHRRLAFSAMTVSDDRTDEPGKQADEYGGLSRPVDGPPTTIYH